tara:strand:+ start:1371 stop:1715 length:345 start_codon:yes stop_codon:yes gene_type:complete
MSIHTFEIRAPKAKKVYLTGAFNDWDATKLRMKPAGGGVWALSVELDPGKHEFKFVVDGAWCCEPGCDGPHAGCAGCVPNDMGTMNRVVEIPSDAPKAKKQEQPGGRETGSEEA